MINIEELKFDEKGLIPAIVVDAVSKRVLTLAYMNKESLQLSMEKEQTVFYSRSRSCPVCRFVCDYDIQNIRMPEM